MIVGTSEIDITPQPGIELAGFAVRRQPSSGILDPLVVRGLCLADGEERVLWLHADLIALERDFVGEVRRFCEFDSGIPADRVLLSTTHTHSGPATVRGNCIGTLDAGYCEWLVGRFRQAARVALANGEECRMVAAEGHCELGVDRRGRASRHSDPRVGVVGWRRWDETLKAAVVSYSMHPVCLRGSEISADWPGETARCLARKLPGRPMVLVSSGACGNIDPPEVGVSPEQMSTWGGIVAESALGSLLSATEGGELANRAPLRVATRIVQLPLEDWTPPQIHEHADRCAADLRGRQEFGEKFSRAIEAWRRTMLRRAERIEPPRVEAELFGIGVGKTVFLAFNAEAFSRFTELVRSGCPRSVYPIGCANGMIGYLPTAKAYDDGDYEVEWSMLFYDRPRARRGSLELLAEHARKLAAELAGA
jgi:neutral ceramidase